MIKKENNEETIIQNKIAIAIFNITLFVGIVTLFESVIVSPHIIQRMLYVIMGIPALFYFIYLIFLPLRYKKPYPNTFFVLEDLEILPSKVDQFYNWASSSIFLMLYSSLVNIVYLIIGKIEEISSLDIHWSVKSLILAIVSFVIVEISIKLLGLKHADYILEDFYKKIINRRKKTR